MPMLARDAPNGFAVSIQTCSLSLLRRWCKGDVRFGKSGLDPTVKSRICRYHNGDAERPFQAVLPKNRAFVQIVDHEVNEKGQRPQITGRLPAPSEPHCPYQSRSDQPYKKQESRSPEAQQDLQIPVMR